MRKTHFSASCALALILCISCATPPDVTEAPLSSQQEDNQAGIEPSEDQPAVSETPQQEIEESTEPIAPDATEDSTPRTPEETDTAEIASVTEEEPTSTAPTQEAEPLPQLTPAVLPEKPRTGEEITVSVDEDVYETVLFDFGAGPVETNSHTYQTFGVKTVDVTAVSGEQSTSARLQFPVFGEGRLSLESNEVEHDSSWEPVVNATLQADGEFDTIKIFENGVELYEIPAPESYRIPVPFTGEREFSAELYHLDVHVADIAPVTIIGLNSPPPKPAYEGAQFISASPGEEVEFSVTARDPNNDPVRFDVKFAPENAVFDEDTGIFIWTPSAAERGVYLLHFTAYDVPYGLASPFTQRGIMVQ